MFSTLLILTLLKFKFFKNELFIECFNSNTKNKVPPQSNSNSTSKINIKKTKVHH